MDPMVFLQTKDPQERQLMWAITRKAHEIHEMYARSQAVLIQEGIAKLLGGR